jgi:hypothetical protein
MLLLKVVNGCWMEARRPVPVVPDYDILASPYALDLLLQQPARLVLAILRPSGAAVGIATSSCVSPLEVC